MKCPFCNKEVETLEETTIYINDEKIETISLCPDCLEKVKSILEDENFGEHLMKYIKELDENWEKGTAENVKVGSVIKIVELFEEKDLSYVNRTGVVEFIDDAGQLHGSWGGLAVIPEKDKFLVLRADVH